MANRTNFWKYSANGNHFILLDGFQGAEAPTSEQIIEWCDPAFGVGADGLAWLGPADNSSEAFRFRLWNSDGGEAEMCGNAARVAAAHFMRAHMSDTVVFKTMNGVYHATLENDRLWLKMTEKQVGPAVDPLLFNEFKNHFVVNTGVPHLVLHIEDVSVIEIAQIAPQWRYHEVFPRGTNVDYISVPDVKVPFVNLRVYERGVEGETLSCGTGVAAVAWACRDFFNWKDQVTVKTKGGEHLVRWDADEALWYSGDIKLCFTGETA